MPVEVGIIEKLRSKKKVAKSAITRNVNRVRKLVNNKESVSKVRQYAKNIKEAREKARIVINELEKADPSSIVADGELLVDVECDVTDALGEVADYLQESSPLVKTLQLYQGTVVLVVLKGSGFAKQLGVQGQRQNLTVDTVGGVRTTLKSQHVRVPFAPAVTDIDVDAWTMKNICEPVQSVDWTEIKKQYEHLRDVPVMSVGETAVDVLLGLDAASLMAPLEVRPGKHGQPCAELTPLGSVVSCLESVEHRLQKDPKLADGYCKAITAYVKKDFARKLSPEEFAMDREQWLLPHHPVINSHKPLPRVVFDSAAKHDGVCLNDCLETGPSLHNDLPGILLRFHERPIALVGDVSDMFCHVLVKEEDRKYHRYLWRDMNSTRPPDVYEMNCLVIGDKSSPCEANFPVIRRTEDNQDQWPEAAATVRRDIFVDDFYSSCNDAMMCRRQFP
ncbi:Hypothetical predicted protein [Paramuricea clavata]|uniref:Uncharacterized protein n=1 Tax=Paramuricea clavata TaxID=317549 RepID=A0A7D9HHF0_PARCT|nr:Hypothetical predicted protein [Paramuricea clavata]